jgi:glucan phosphoethanolaminetransferase (alkaline phosphatase superfamily)
MKNTQKKWVEFLNRATLATVYFLLFVMFVILTALACDMVHRNPSWYPVVQFIGMLLGAIIFLIAFISSWEDIFNEEEDED